MFRFSPLLFLLLLANPLGESLKAAEGSAPAQVVFAFPLWEKEQMERYVKELEKTHKSLTAEDLKRAEERLKKAMAENDWYAAVTEAERLCGAHLEDGERWLKLSATYKKRKENNKGDETDWEGGRRSQFAAMKAFTLATNGEEKARALFYYGDAADHLSHFRGAFEAIRGFGSIAALREKYPDLKDKMLFKFHEKSLDAGAATPSLCLTFNHPLTLEGVNYLDYLDISPKIDSFVKVTDNKMVLTGFEYGARYVLTLKEGLPSASGEKLDKTQKIDLLIPDQDARLSFHQGAYVLMKDEKAQIPLTSLNVERVNVKIFRLNDRNLTGTLFRSYNFMNTLGSYETSKFEDREGEVVYSGEMDLSKERNVSKVTQIPFSDAVKNPKVGVYVTQVTQKNILADYGHREATQWMIVTDLGISTYWGASGLDVGVHSLKTTHPVSHATVKLLARNNEILAEQKSDKTGFVHFAPELLNGKGGNGPLAILVYGEPQGSDKVQDFSFLALNKPAFDLSDRGVAGRPKPGPLDAYVYLTRGVYRPGETVHIQALLRDDQAIAKGYQPLTLKISRPDGKEVHRQTLTGNESGFYELTLPLSPASRTGQWTVEAYHNPKESPIGQTTFSVEDFVPSRLLVNVSAKEKKLKPNTNVEVSVSGKYLFGSKAADLSGSAELMVKLHPNPFPKQVGYIFGDLKETFEGKRIPIEFTKVNKDGKGELQVSLGDFPSVSKPLESQVRVTLLDKGGRAQLGTLKFATFTNPFYIGLKPHSADGIFDENAAEAVFSVVAVNEEGNPIDVSDLAWELYAEDLSYTWYQKESYSSWHYRPVYSDRFLSKGTVSTQKGEPQTLTLPISDWGRYRLVVKDAKTGAMTSFRFSKGWQGSQEAATPDKLQISSDRPTYKIGDVAKIHIKPPFAGEAIVVVAHNHVIEKRHVPVHPDGTEFHLKVTKDWGAGAYVLVTALKPLDTKTLREKPFLPKRAIGVSWLGIAKEEKELKVRLDLPEEIRPRQKISIPVSVKEASGGAIPKKAHVTVAVVDEGILMLTDFATPAPQHHYLGQRILGVELRDLYGRLIMPLEGNTGTLRSGGDEGTLARRLAALSKRSFKIVSLQTGLVSLSNKGEASIAVEIPDFQGTLRVMAVAFNEDKIGSADGKILVRDPIVTEAVFPRFLTVGDEGQMALSFHNVSKQKERFKVSWMTTEGLSSSASELSLDLDPEAEHTEKVMLKALERGDQKVSLTVQKLDGEGKPSLSEPPIAHVYELTIKAPALPVTRTEAVLLAAGESRKTPAIKEHTDFLKGTQSVTYTWTAGVPWNPARFVALLNDYGYGCAEQLISRAFGELFQLQERVGREQKGGGEQSIPDHKLRNLLAAILEKQNPEGAIHFWGQGSQEKPWFTAFYVDLLQQTQEWIKSCEKKGVKTLKVEIPPISYQSALDVLKAFVKRRGSRDSSQELISASYALYLLVKADQIEAGGVRYFYETYFEQLNDPLAKALCAASLARIGDLIKAKEAFSKAAEAPDHPEETPYGTTVRNKAGIVRLVAETIHHVPDMRQDLMPLLNVLLKRLQEQTGGKKVFSTQEAAWLLNATTFVQQSDLGGEEPENAHAKGVQVHVDGDSHHHSSMVSLDFSSSVPPLSVQNKGKKPLWQHCMITGIPATPPPAQSAGMEVKRRYYSLEGTEVSLESVKQGESLIVIIEGKVDSPKDNPLLIVDPLPAGFEIESASVEGKKESKGTRQNQKPKKGMLGKTWDLADSWLDNLSKTDYTEIRDDRFVASLSIDTVDDRKSQSGSFRIAYRVRAVGVGTFIHPGLLVEDMCNPALCANTEGGKVIVNTLEKR